MTAAAAAPALAPPAVAATPHIFPCILDEQPTFLMPRRLLAKLPRPATEDLIVNPLCSFTWDKRAPENHVAACRALYGSEGSAVCVEDAATGALSPFALAFVCEGWLREARPGKPLPAGWPAEAVELFAKAGIVAPRDAAEQRKREWRSVVEQAGPQFRGRGYVNLGDLLHPFHIGALRSHYRWLIRKGKMPLGDAQSPLRHVEHNESVARFFHQQLTRMISDIAGEPLKASYVYSSCYLGGAELESHTDRAQCEFSISFAVDFSPEPQAETPWPLCLETKKGTVKVSQALGDGLLYRGRRLEHFRTRLKSNATSTSIFFHYVRRSFKGKLD